MKDFQALESPQPLGTFVVIQNKTKNMKFSFSCFWFIVAFLDQDPLTLFDPDSQHC
jgi:hypothetical protein